MLRRSIRSRRDGNAVLMKCELRRTNFDGSPREGWRGEEEKQRVGRQQFTRPIKDPTHDTRVTGSPPTPTTVLQIFFFFSFL